MWFATDDGLNKFDGTNFTVYRNRRGDTTSLKANEILALHEDKKGNLWVGTSGGGLSLYNRHKDAFINYPVNGIVDGISHSSVIRSICSDYLGNIWIAQFEALYMLDTKTNNITKIAFPPQDNERIPKTTLFCVFEDSRHRIWVGADNGLYLYTRSTNTIKLFARHSPEAPGLPGNKVRTIAEDKYGTIWVGTEGGLCRLQPDERGFITYQHIPGNKSSLSNNTVNCISANDNGILWIGTGDGLNLFDPQQQVFTVYRPEPGNIHSLTSRSIRCAYIDKQGIYWIGTFRGGIDKYDRNINLFNLQPGNSFPVNNNSGIIVSAFAEKNDGNLFVGTESGLFEFNRITKSVQPVDVPVNTEPGAPLTVLYLHKSRDNKLYVGTFEEGVYIKDLTTGSWQHLKNGPGAGGPGSNEIFCISEDSKGNIWIGSNGQGINMLHTDKTVTRFTPAPSPNNPNEKLLPVNGYIRAIAEDTEGNIWIGTHGGGVAVFHPANGKWTIYTQDNSQLSSDKIQSILCDSHGNVWIGTYGEGLCLYDKSKNKFITFSERDGLQNTTIYQIVEDLQGRIWLSSNAGISCFDTGKKTFRNFTGYNGVLTNNFVHGSGICLHNGEVFFGGQEGFNYFNPAQLTINNNVPRVLLTDLRVSNKSVSPGNESPIKDHISIAREVRLDYKQNFAFSFVALNYSIPKQNNYAYKLEGFDKDWIYTGPLNTASYTNLDPGEYTFHVKASNNDGVWSKQETLIKIFVRPPLWRTTYAYLLYALAIGGLLLYIRYRGITKLRRKFALEQERQQVKRMQELDRMKLKFLTNLSHDFRTPISLIMGPVEQLIKEENGKGGLEKLDMIRRNARRLLNLVNQLLDFRKMEEHELRLQPAKGEFVSFVKEVSDSFRDLSERKHIHFEFTSDINSMQALFDHDKIERVLFNLLSNAFKFTLEGGNVRVEIHRYKNENDKENTWVTLQVIDTGIGIAADKKEKIFERFFQTNSPSAILNQGTGIGLSITKEFIKMHGGKIEVESEPDKGCVFTIHLPLKPAPATVTLPEPPEETAEPVHLPAVEPEALPETTIDESAPEDISILLVEDNEDFRFYLKDNLRNNYKVLEAVNGKEGWQKALAQHPRLIVSDITMPEMNGIALVKKLKGDKRTSHIPVILLTALTGEEQQLRGLETGANDYITKPFNFEVLNAKIKSLLELQNTLKTTYTKQIKILTPETEVTSTDEKLLQEIVLFLENNLNNPQLSVEGLSKEVGMSRSTLYTKLLQLTGKTPVEYIRSFRLEKAAVLMQKSNMTIAEIAYQVGFTTPNYFARSFKSKYNMLPSEYIARNRK